MPGVEVSTPLTELGLDLPLSWLEASIMMVMILLLTPSPQRERDQRKELSSFLPSDQRGILSVEQACPSDFAGTWRQVMKECPEPVTFG